MSYKNYEKRKSRRRENHRERRLEIINFLGGVCVRCGFSDWRALQIDHVIGGGSKERKENRKNSYAKTYYQMIIEDTSGKYQLLCANCNWIKRYENLEERKDL
jgi:hypothetical protein